MARMVRRPAAVATRLALQRGGLVVGHCRIAESLEQHDGVEVVTHGVACDQEPGLDACHLRQGWNTQSGDGFSFEGRLSAQLSNPGEHSVKLLQVTFCRQQRFPVRAYLLCRVHSVIVPVTTMAGQLSVWLALDWAGST